METIQMKRTLFSVIGAMLLAGVFLTPSTASAQSVGFGVQIGGGHHGRHGGFSIEIYSNDRWHRHPGRGPVWRDRGCGWDYPCDNRRGPVYRGGGRRGGDWGHHGGYRQPETIRVRVTEWVWDDYRGCEVPMQRIVTAYYDYRTGDYYYIDYEGYRVWLRNSRGW
jgi:hypothetical protein